jgi:hypothetical protein
MAAIDRSLLRDAQWADFSASLDNQIEKNLCDLLGEIAEGMEAPTCLELLTEAEQQIKGHPVWGSDSLSRVASALGTAIRRSRPETVLPIQVSQPITSTPPSTRLVIPAELVEFVSLTSFGQLEQRYGYSAERPAAFGLMGEFLRNKSPNWRAKPLAEVFEAIVEELPHSKALTVLRGLKEMASHGTEAKTAYHSHTSKLFG